MGSSPKDLPWELRVNAKNGEMNREKYGCGSKPCTPVVHIKIAGKWMFIPLKMVLIGIDPYPYGTVGFYQSN